MERLKKIFEIQQAFDRKVTPSVYDDSLSIEDKEKLTKEIAFDVIRETTELVDCTNSKRHKLLRNPVNEHNIVEEFVDIFKFLLNLGAVWGIDDETLYNEFMRKSEVVEQKWQQEQLLKSISTNDKIVAIDIDGVLAEYPAYFLQWCYDHGFRDSREWYNAPYATIQEFIREGGRALYNSAKDTYRKSGAKAHVPAELGADTLTHELRNMGYKIVLISARPYKLYTRIFADTMNWLKKNDVVFDAIVFDRDKEDFIVNRFKDNLTAFIDDDIGNVKKVAACGYPSIWVKRWQLDENYFKLPVFEARDALEALRIFKEFIHA